eukprot:scaffold315_cov251-Pinguiococcus_pyrenoidosus.AAC.4
MGSVYMLHWAPPERRFAKRRGEVELISGAKRARSFAPLDLIGGIPRLNINLPIKYKYKISADWKRIGQSLAVPLPSGGDPQNYVNSSKKTNQSQSMKASHSFFVRFVKSEADENWLGCRLARCVLAEGLLIAQCLEWI